MALTALHRRICATIGNRGWEDTFTPIDDEWLPLVMHLLNEFDSHCIIAGVFGAYSAYLAGHLTSFRHIYFQMQVQTYGSQGLRLFQHDPFQVDYFQLTHSVTIFQFTHWRVTNLRTNHTTTLRIRKCCGDPMMWLDFVWWVWLSMPLCCQYYAIVNGRFIKDSCSVMNGLISNDARLEKNIIISYRIYAGCRRPTVKMDSDSPSPETCDCKLCIRQPATLKGLCFWSLRRLRCGIKTNECSPYHPFTSQYI